MYNTAIIVVQFVATLESLIIIVGNIFTIFVFWKHRNRLKGTFFLLINLAVADLFIGFTELASGPFKILELLEKTSFNGALHQNILTLCQVAFSFASVFFLTLISLERAYALIWPLRHRASPSKAYIYSATFAWGAAIFTGTLALLAVYHILDFFHWMLVFGSVLASCLVTICVSYLAIRARLNCRVPPIDGPQNRRNEQLKNAKLSRTLFIMITASLVFWIPSIVVYCIQYRCSKCVSLLLLRIFNLFRLANSLVNPIIYSFRIPMFRETFKAVKLRKQSKKYTINNYTPGNVIEDSNGTAPSFLQRC